MLYAYFGANRNLCCVEEILEILVGDVFMKMSDKKPMKLKSNLGQRNSPPANVNEVLAELDREAAERDERRQFRINYFIDRYGNASYGDFPRADNCLHQAFKRERSEDVWRTFVSILGSLNDGDLNEFVNDTFYQNRGEYPWQVALRRLERGRTSWRNIITILNSKPLDRPNLCDEILDIFQVPHKDDIGKKDCAACSNPVADPSIDSTISSLANGKEPEENDDHNNSELSDHTLSPTSNDGDKWLQDAVAGVEAKTDALKQGISSSSFNETLPSYQSQLPYQNHCYPTVEVERGTKNLDNRSLNPFISTSPSFSQLSSGIANAVKDEEVSDEKALWKLPCGQQINDQPVSMTVSYHEDKERTVTANPFGQQFSPPNSVHNIVSSVASTMAAVNSSITTTPQIVMASPYPFVAYPGTMQSPPVQFMYVPFASLPPFYSPQPQSLPTTVAGGPWTPPSPGVATLPVSISTVPSPNINPANIAEGYQPTPSVATSTVPSTVPGGLPCNTTAGVNTSSSTNLLRSTFNNNNSAANENCISMPVAGNHGSNSARGQPAGHPPTSPSPPVASSGAASMPNLNRNALAVFLTYSTDANDDAKTVKQKLAQRFPGIVIITHDVLNLADELVAAERIERVFHNVDYVIPIISKQYLDDVAVTNSPNNGRAHAIRCMYVKCLTNFHFDGSRNLKVRALRLHSVPYEDVKYLPTCMSTARADVDELVNVLYYARNRMPGNNVI